MSHHLMLYHQFSRIHKNKSSIAFAIHRFWVERHDDVIIIWEPFHAVVRVLETFVDNWSYSSLMAKANSLVAAITGFSIVLSLIFVKKNKFEK